MSAHTSTQTARSKWTDKAVYAAGAVVWRLIDGKPLIDLQDKTMGEVQRRRRARAVR